MYYHTLREKYSHEDEFIPQEKFEQKEDEFVHKYKLNYKAAQIYIYALNNKTRDDVMRELRFTSQDIQRYSKEVMNKVV